MADQPVVPRRTGRPAFIAAVVLVIGVLATLPWSRGMWDEWTTSLQRETATMPTVTDLPAAASTGEAGSLLIIGTDDDKRGAAFALIASGAEPLIVLFPPSLFEILPGYGDFPLADAPLFEDSEFAALVVENALGIRVDAHVALNADEFEGVVGRDLVVDLSDDTHVASSNGDSLVAPAGELTRPREQLGELLVQQGSSGELVWVERQAALWAALMEEAAQDAGVGERLASLASDPGLVVPILAGSAGVARVALIPVERTGAGDGDGFVLDRSAASSFVQDRLGSLQYAQGDRPRVEVLNGTGENQVSRPIVEELVRLGFHVVRTDNAPTFDHEQTLIVAQALEYQGAAERIAASLGIGQVQLEVGAVSNVVDLSIIVGQDAPSAED